MVCDGSYKKGRSTSAFTTISEIRTRIRGTNVVPGRDEDQSSYQGKLGGILGAIVCANVVMKKHKVDEGQITLGCDNEGAIKALDTERNYTSRWNSYDILFQIQKEIKKSPAIWKFIHVKGHQDDDTNEEELDKWARANILVDTMAKNAMKQYLEDGRPKIQPLPTNGNIWKIKIKGKIITKNVMREIDRNTWDQKIKKYWSNKMGTDNLEVIDWKILRRTNKLVTRSKRQWRTKQVANIGPTANTLHQRKHRASAICPRCNIVENSKHIHKCKMSETDDIFNHAMEGLEDYLHSNCTDQLAIAILMLVKSAQTRMEPEWERITNDKVLECMQEQWVFNYTGIRWGIWTTGWTSIQDKFLKGTWFAKLSNKIWKITEDLWKHRNHCEHEDMGSRINLEQNNIVNATIDNIYDRLPSNTRLLPMADRKFLRKNADWKKKRRLRGKIKWSRQAIIILEAYEKIEETSPEASLL